MFQSLHFIELSLFIITIISSLIYVGLLFDILKGWNGTADWKTPPKYSPKKTISVIIAARNEENFIGYCIESILNCDYPKELIEIIVVNDHSEDRTKEIVRKYQNQNVHLYDLEEVHGKKNALEKGISKAKGDLIACTDADCLVSREWLILFESYFQKNNPKCVAGPISYLHDSSVLQRFQYLDALNNMCVTANGIKKKSYFMANGANLWYTKDVFLEIGGYQKKNDFASGDDMFLIQEIANRYPDSVRFLKSRKAIVKTQPETTFKDLLNQRTRWATKSKAYSNKNIVRIQGFVFYFILLILINLLSAAFGTGLSMIGFITAIIIKLSIDYFYLSKLSKYFGDQKPLISFFSVSIGFMAYIIFTGLKALAPTTYSWKGRKTK